MSSLLECLLFFASHFSFYSAKLRDNIDEAYEEIVRRIRQCSTKLKDKPATKTKPEKKKLGLGGLLKKIGGKK